MSKQKLADFAPTGQYVPLHLSGAVASATRAPVQRAAVSTTATTAIAGAGAATTVTPASMTNITIGRVLLITGGTGTAEEVSVTAVTATTFTANFQNAHSGTYNITDRGNGHWLGTVVIGAAGSGMTLTLYNGNPAMAYSPAPIGFGTIAVITPVAGASYVFNADCEYDLYYTYTGTTPGDVSIMYRPKP